MTGPLLAGEQGAGVLPTAGLVVAFAVFVSIVVWVFLVPKSAWQRDARIPLEGDARADARKESSHE